MKKLVNLLLIGCIGFTACSNVAPKSETKVYSKAEAKARIQKEIQAKMDSITPKAQQDLFDVKASVEKLEMVSKQQGAKILYDSLKHVIQTADFEMEGAIKQATNLYQVIQSAKGDDVNKRNYYHVITMITMAGEDGEREKHYSSVVFTPDFKLFY